MYRLSFSPLESAGAARQLSSLPRPVALIDGFEAGLLLSGIANPAAGLATKQLSAEEEKKMEQKIQQKLGGIDAILQKAVKLHPGIFSNQDQLASAADVTKQKTT